MGWEGQGVQGSFPFQCPFWVVLRGDGGDGQGAPLPARDAVLQRCDASAPTLDALPCPAATPSP
eukprot:3328101-Prymnesium_polylepis.1